MFSYHHRQKSQITTLYAMLIVYHAIVWFLAYRLFHNNPLLFSTSILAYTLGLQHAVDADHIAAIDNVSRKLIEDGKQPLCVGLLFALGHSTVVLLATLGIALTTTTFMRSHLLDWQTVGSTLFTSVSALFLFSIAIANLRTTHHTYCLLKNTQTNAVSSLHLVTYAPKRFSRVFQYMRKSWYMYPLGFLFGLGFDTATEISLLGITASETFQGLPLSAILIFPALFTAGMTLIDTTDGVIMLKAYTWALVNPLRKLHYNAIITGASAMIALIVGSIEVLGLITNKMDTHNHFTTIIQTINEHFQYVGYVIIAFFIACWIVSILY